MSRGLLMLALGLMAFAALAPAVEAALPCEEACAADDRDGGCSLELCCSCCVHVRIAPPRLPGQAGAAPTTNVTIAAITRMPSPDPREILHVPKPLPR